MAKSKKSRKKNQTPRITISKEHEEALNELVTAGLRISALARLVEEAYGIIAQATQIPAHHKKAFCGYLQMKCEEVTGEPWPVASVTSVRVRHNGDGKWALVGSRVGVPNEA